MKVVFFVLDNADLLMPLVDELNAHDIKGGTIFNTTGMGRKLLSHDDFPIFGSLRAVLDYHLRDSKTFMFVIDDAKINNLIEIIEKVVGDLEKPDTGILFSFPLDYVKGIKLR